MRIARALRLVDYGGDLTFGGFMATAMAIAIVGVGGIVFGIVAPIANHTGHVSCLRLHEVTGMETRYVRSGLNGECYIRENGQWVPESRWRVGVD